MLLSSPGVAETGDSGEETAILARGAELVDRFVCRSCHVIGDEPGGMVGPDLNMVLVRRSRDWLLRWLVNPAALKPDTLMPRFELSAEDREVLVAYLAQFARPVDAGAILERAASKAEAGEQLVRAYECYACHKVAGEAGRMLNPDLSTVAERHTADWERKWLAGPDQVKPGTFMPDFGLSERAIDAIVEYLYH